MTKKSQYDCDYCSYVVETHGNTVYKICKLYLKSEADVEDVFQQVFLTLIEKKPSFKDSEHEKAWLIKVASNKCKDFLKNYWNKNTISIENVDSPIEENSSNEVITAVAALDNNYKLVIFMYYYQGYSTSEISEILKVKEATIRTRLKRAREKLKEKLEVDYFYE
ncbi:RNA polymerase sigma factor [Clostridium manihotivorum]|uniref:RNA polymerase subunit sigma-24 n=1 Tax=Clostridium manihotivorum TaxID=2320868 RepID=A0A410DXW5_9CLOT|nr:sigma-70 family RNA polymerase sigma factor [Clostridium manihotivorum]QAA33838.1 RNA polymerase subunit sigma-24 [Clostridium manihotivorum]